MEKSDVVSRYLVAGLCKDSLYDLFLLRIRNRLSPNADDSDRGAGRSLSDSLLYPVGMAGWNLINRNAGSTSESPQAERARQVP